MRVLGLSVGIAAMLLAPLLAGCDRPFLAKDGTMHFEKGARGAGVMTANGVEFHDRNDLPRRVVARDVNEPWRAPIGFILPRDGRFTEKSRPHVLATTGLSIVIRPSDTRVPAWGGEILVRVDVIAPAAEGGARWGENVAIVVDGKGPDTIAFLEIALAQLAGRDRVTVIDTLGAAVLVPPMPASHRSMIVAAFEAQRRAVGSEGPRLLAASFDVAAKAIASAEVTQRVLLLSDRASTEADPEIARLAGRGLQVAAVSTVGEGETDRPEREEAIRTAVPAAGFTTFRNVFLTFQGTPAPSHVLEASGGEARWRLDAGELVLGNVHAGESRTEMLRITVPPWVANETFRFNVTAHVDDLAWGGPREFSAEVPCIYDDDIERIAKSRHGDVIAYASAMATLRKLDGAFTGDAVNGVGGLQLIAEKHAKSMSLLARDTRDAAIQEQADMLAALLAATKAKASRRR